jgi:ABC-2 type transport system ATP-binding protein
MAIIRVDGLVKTYPGPVEAVRGLGFSVERGEIFGLLGPNGAGKSTTVRILATLSAPTAGRAEVAGFDVATRPQEVRRRIGYVAQGSAVDLQATARENLALQGRLYGLRGAALGGRVEELLVLFDLTDAANRLAHTFSGGMRRRLDLAMGLVHRPSILFLDEPTTGLDPESRAVLWREVERQAREEELTILLTTHYLEEADRLADRVAIVDEGRVVAQGTTDELKRTLSGDRISVELAAATQIADGVAALRAVEGVAEVAVEGRVLHTQVQLGGSAVPTSLQALDRAGVMVAQVSVSRPSLDDVYLSLTGKSFGRAESVSAPKQMAEVVAA